MDGDEVWNTIADFLAWVWAGALMSSSELRGFDLQSWSGIRCRQARRFWARK
jgi:hypothetical protein